jgi:hypothetical protein
MLACLLTKGGRTTAMQQDFNGALVKERRQCWLRELPLRHDDSLRPAHKDGGGVRRLGTDGATESRSAHDDGGLPEEKWGRRGGEQEVKPPPLIGARVGVDRTRLVGRPAHEREATSPQTPMTHGSLPVGAGTCWRGWVTCVGERAGQAVACLLAPCPNGKRRGVAAAANGRRT